ncbi:hypothetical protein DEO72_LG1g2761 [Vigna unguiculata]|uniref:Uncharacterized protein n=1 Tax=Vigna unguiculata TaxID=3917 RepID=A0A4D6KNJ1_VIGUN|nr:hypothetical protein DEO72_LG1g2761 [Vigna unguiculata]
MNLPAHGAASPDPSKASSSVKTTHTAHNLPRKRLAHQPVLPGETGSDRLAVRREPPGASALPAPLDSIHRLAEHFLTARRPTMQGPL